MDEVDRLCRVRVGSDLDEVPFRLDADGYLDPPNRFSPQRTTGAQLVAPVTLSETQSFALLGEPGSGKTFVLDKIHAHWVEQLGREHVFFVDAMDLTESQYPEMLGSLLEGLPDADDGSAPDGPAAVERVVIVDQLDESPILKSLAGRLDRSMHGRRTAGLRLVLACRQMNYPPALDAQLKQLLKFEAADLAPLTREQAIAIGDAEGVSGEALTKIASERGVAVLASVPLTLVMLCDMFKANGDLVGTAVDIFRMAVARSAEEFSNPDVAAGFIPALGRNQRLAIGQRLAAQLLLTGRRNIWTGVGAAPRDTDLDLGSAATGMEGPPEARFEVTQQLVQQTLGCALFSATGDGRTAFRHSSIAAFLAAEHLIAHEVPEGQLRQLLLVEQTFGDTWLTIPTPLRETAAWLIGLAPQKMMWLLAADPLSLTAYSSLVDSDGARELLVSKLIESADDAYLSDSWWRRRGSFKLVHPGLGGQVLVALNGPGGNDWRSRARLQLLLELAESSRDPLLADKLWEIAFTEDLDARSRRLAVDAFSVCCPGRVSGLRKLLKDLQAAERAGQVDPDDELRSALLRVLWPAHLSAAELIEYLTPRRNESLFGGYAAFLWSGAAREASDEQVLEVLNVLAAKSSEGTAPVGEHRLTGHSGAPELARDFVLAFVDRALTGPSAEDAIPTIAQVLAPFLARSVTLTIPTALDEWQRPLDPDRAIHLRRLLAIALVEQAHADDSPFETRDVLHGWQAKTELQLPETKRPQRRAQLLDHDDFRWLAAHAEARLEHARRSALAIADMAGQVLDATNADDYERAYELFQRTGPDAQAIASWFNAVRTDSWAAKAWRRDHDLAEQAPWEREEDFANEAQELLTRIEAGESVLFPSLAYMLHFSARTGKGHHPAFNDDLLSYPGVPALGSDGPERLRDAARTYLDHADDDRDRWLGTTLLDPVPRAGYLALCILDRDPANETTIPFDRWVGAVISYLATFGSDSEIRHTRLLNTAAAVAPAAFADAFDTFVRRTLEGGSVPYGIHALSTTIDPIVGARLLTTTRSIRAAVERKTDADLTLPDGAESNAVQTWRDLTSLLIRARVDGAIDEAQNTLAFKPGTPPSQLTLAAVTVLMSTAVSSTWPIIRRGVGTGVITALPVVYAMARDSYPGIDLATMSDDDLVGYYLWLRELLPQSEDVNPPGAHWVGAREEAQRLRGRTLETLSQRATPRTLELLRDAIANDDAIELVAAERRIRSQLAEIGWRAPTVEDLASMIEDPVRRLVRTDAELARLIIETLTDIAGNIASHGDLLWDRVPTTVASAALKVGLNLRHQEADHDRELWSPKLESSLSEYLANQLELRLRQRRVVVNREVVVRPTDAKGAGERVDLLVQVRHNNTTDATVPVEIKGHWNDGVETALTTQLADRYLPDTGAKAGVYVVGWWPIPQWSVEEDRRTHAATHTEKQLQSTLTDAAAELSRTRAVSLIPFVLRIPRPARNTAA